MLWLEASLTNSDPGVIAGYFIETLRAKGGCPRFIRADAGTEDSSVQQLLRKNSHDVYLQGECSKEVF